MAFCGLELLAWTFPFLVWANTDFLSCPAGPDEQVLRSAKIDTSATGLIAFFRSQSLTESQQRELARMVRRLGSEVYADRTRASSEITSLGPSALPALRNARHHPDPEIARRAESCME